MDNDMDIKCNLHMRKKLEKLYEEGNFHGLFTAIHDLIPGSITKDFRGDPEKPGWKSQWKGSLEFLKWLIAEVEKTENSE